MDLEAEIKRKIQSEFNPEYLELINESHVHAGHVGDNGTGQTHFKLIIASKSLNTYSRIQAHSILKKYIEPYFSMGLHAVSIKICKE